MLPYTVIEGRSRRITCARTVVPDHKHAQNVGFYSWFSCHIFGTQLFQENRLFYFHTRLLLNPLISLTNLLGSLQCQTKRSQTDCMNRNWHISWFACYIFPTRLFQENHLHLFSCLCDAKAAGIAHKSARSL